jgi:hypothetical protein
MDHASTEESARLRSAFGRPATDRDWPFPPRPARRAPSQDLEQAAVDLLAATARAWGLAARAPRMRQAS